MFTSQKKCFYIITILATAAILKEEAYQHLFCKIAKNFRYIFALLLICNCIFFYKFIAKLCTFFTKLHKNPTFTKKKLLVTMSSDFTPISECNQNLSDVKLPPHLQVQVHSQDRRNIISLEHFIPFVGMVFLFQHFSQTD